VLGAVALRPAWLGARGVHFSSSMKALTKKAPQSGKVGYALAWLLGVPIPILLIVYLISRC
jgi:hypothetical protein